MGLSQIHTLYKEAFNTKLKYIGTTYTVFRNTVNTVGVDFDPSVDSLYTEVEPFTLIGLEEFPIYHQLITDAGNAVSNLDYHVYFSVGSDIKINDILNSDVNSFVVQKVTNNGYHIDCIVDIK